MVKKYPNDPIIYGKFITLKKSFKRLVKENNKFKKEQLLQKITEMNEKDPKLFWKLIKKLKETRGNREDPVDLDIWNNHFSQLHNIPLVNNKDKALESLIDSKLNELDTDDTKVLVDQLDKPFTILEISKGIKGLKLGKSCGPDSILNEMLKAATNILAPCILKLFNAILLHESLPSKWAAGFLVPIFKKGDDTDPNNYRGISITSCLGKLFTRIYNERLLEFLHIKDAMSNCQIGFAKGKRTSDHIFVLKCILEEAKINKKPIYGCFVDLKKAFDTVWRNGLLYKLLSQYDVSTKFVKIIQNLYKDLSGQVKVNNVLSESFPINIGLRQGCNLSPVLFNLYINDLPKLLKLGDCDPVDLFETKINVLMFADDMLLLSKSPSGLQKTLNLLQVYCRKWQLLVNCSKTKIMIFNKINSATKFLFENKVLDEVDEYKYLGVTFHKSGTFTKAINDLAGSAQRAFFAIKSIQRQNKLNPRIFIKLFDTLVKPILLYCSEVWGGGWYKNTKASITSPYNVP